MAFGCLAAAAAWAAAPAAVAGATVAYWRFENNLLDETANGNHATATGTAFSGDVFGTPVPATGGANAASIQFSNPVTVTVGSAVDYLQVPHHASLNIATGSFTIEAWVRLNQFGTGPERQYVLQKKSAGVGDIDSSYVFMARAGDLNTFPNALALALHNNTTGTIADAHYVFSSLGIEDNDWHHISVAVDRSTGDVRFTLDDQVDLQAGAALGPLFAGQDNSQTLIIGAHHTLSSPNFGFDGWIDELRISNAYLDTDQLLAVPEPGALACLLAGLVLLLAWRQCGRRRFW